MCLNQRFGHSRFKPNLIYFFKVVTTQCYQDIHAFGHAYNCVYLVYH